MIAKIDLRVVSELDHLTRTEICKNLVSTSSPSFTMSLADRQDSLFSNSKRRSRGHHAEGNVNVIFRTGVLSFFASTGYFGYIATIGRAQNFMLDMQPHGQRFMIGFAYKSTSKHQAEYTFKEFEPVSS